MKFYFLVAMAVPRLGMFVLGTYFSPLIVCSSVMALNGLGVAGLAGASSVCAKILTAYGIGVGSSLMGFALGAAIAFIWNENDIFKTYFKAHMLPCLIGSIATGLCVSTALFYLGGMYSLPAVELATAVAAFLATDILVPGAVMAQINH